MFKCPTCDLEFDTIGELHSHIREVISKLESFLDGQATGNPDGWTEWGRFVLLELRRLADVYEKLEEKCDKQFESMKETIWGMKLTIAKWGVGSGSVAGGVVYGFIQLAGG